MNANTTTATARDLVQHALDLPHGDVHREAILSLITIEDLECNTLFALPLFGGNHD